MAPSATNGTNGTNVSTKLQFDTFDNVINGKLASTSQTRHGINPATKEPNPEVPVSTEADLDEAVAAAKAAFKTWSRVPVEERREKLLAYAEALKEHTDEFAKLLTAEQGKPLVFATDEVGAGYRWLTVMGKMEVPEEVIEDNEERKVITRYTPLGVVGAIVPWNFPIQLGVFPS
jgi:acyl-CoA reductase-like NAD-dependent aldehyde dehydrogenase